MVESNQVVLNGTYNKTPGQKYKITPLPDKYGHYPSCVRRVNNFGEMILSEKDIAAMNEGKAVFIPENKTFEISHGTTFNLDDPYQAAVWECIKNSNLIAPERDAKAPNGDLIIDGGRTTVDRNDNPSGRWGVAELYIVRPGASAKVKNDFRKLVNQAEALVFADSLDHMIMICKLFEKDMSHTNSNDVTDFLLTEAQKNPQKVIRYYNSEEASARLLLIMARDKGIIAKRDDGLYYSEIKLGSTMDFAVDKIMQDAALKEEIKKETFPELEKVKTTKSK